MVVQLPSRPLTLDDVAELAAVDDVHRYELDEGNLLVMPPADAEHAALLARLLVWFVTNGYGDDRVLPTPGLRITGRSSGRSPDLVVLRQRVAPGTVWIEPTDVLVVVEIVSPGSQTLDRSVKPAGYARAGIVHYWRVERDGRAATVHRYTLGTDEGGGPAYLGHRADLLTDLLAAPPPRIA
jgi:Uma2 family endonuclease